MREGDVPIKIIPDEEMPITESGVRVEMIVDILGVGNRLNGKQLNEVELNAYKDRVISQSKELGTTQEKHDHLFKFIRMVNEEQYENLEKYYNKLSDYEKEYFIRDMEENSFTLIQNPMYGNLDLDGFDRIATEFNIEPENAYVYKFGRKIKMMNKVIVGDKYVYKLKHHKYVWCINSFNCWEELIA